MGWEAASRERNGAAVLKDRAWPHLDRGHGLGEGGVGTILSAAVAAVVAAAVALVVTAAAGGGAWQQCPRRA